MKDTSFVEICPNLAQIVVVGFFFCFLFFFVLFMEVVSPYNSVTVWLVLLTMEMLTAAGEVKLCRYVMVMKPFFAWNLPLLKHAKLTDRKFQYTIWALRNIYAWATKASCLLEVPGSVGNATTLLDKNNNWFDILFYFLMDIKLSECPVKK